MTVVRCDRCKAEISRDGPDPLVVKRITVDETAGPRGDQRDLCDSCHKELLEWFNDPVSRMPAPRVPPEKP